MATNVPANPEPVDLRAVWGNAIAGLLNPTVLSTFLAGGAAIFIGAARTFGPPVDLDLVYLGLGLLAGVTITRRA